MSGRTMKYPYTLPAKFLHFPWKFHWQKGRFFRYCVYAFIPSYYLFYQIHKAVNSPGNVKVWKEIREHRKHDPFARPDEGKHH